MIVEEVQSIGIQYYHFYMQQINKLIRRWNIIQVVQDDPVLCPSKGCGSVVVHLVHYPVASEDLMEYTRSTGWSSIIYLGSTWTKDQTNLETLSSSTRFLGISLQHRTIHYSSGLIMHAIKKELRARGTTPIWFKRGDRFRCLPYASTGSSGATAQHTMTLLSLLLGYKYLLYSHI